MPLKKSNPKLKRDTELTFEAIGTQWRITLYDYGNPEPSLLKSISRHIETFDVAYSRFRNDSFVTRLAKKAGDYDLPPDAQPMFDLYYQLYGLTAGAMTPLIGQTLVEAGYDVQYSLLPKTVHAPPILEETLDYAYPKLTMRKPALLDFGAIGKGYLVDIIGELLERRGIDDYCVDGGGDIRLRHDSAQIIGLENPEDTSQVVGTVELQSQSLCGSASNRRQWSGYNHIINPKTLHSPDDILAIWVIADTTMLADGLTTALYFSPPDALHKRYTFEYAILYADHTAATSEHFPGSFFRRGQ